ncbi:helicase HerA-like domain-containing protein [Hyphococcus sp. DH-69]|uniref:helicase HerA-like domain-containing protein n=1 Tax=Hyphococcus formosus TaxID=3143534 RepID=UPI00398A7283
MSDQSIFLGKSEKAEQLKLKYANRHGLISGATGTGKTISLQIMAEGFSDAGVPVFVADVKGDLSGLGQPVEMKDFLLERAEKIDLNPYTPRDFPVCFWDLYGKQGHPIRATVSEMGPLLLSRLLDLNDTQEGVLTLAFRLADDEGLLLLDLKDLRALLVEIANRAKELSAEYGHVSRASVGAIQRRLLALEEQGAENFFGEPALDLMDFIRTTDEGKGIVNILAADKLMHTPKLYATFLLWLLSELFEELPEIGDPDKPRLVFFFDEAHLLFDDAPKALLQKVEQVVRLIRSKGVGVFFVTQNPLDVPDSVSSQLGNRLQHALRAFTPREQKVVRAAADTFRPNPAFKTLDVITQLGIGEALVSTLVSKGAPGIVERTLIRPPSSRMGPLTKKERKDIMRYSDMADKYDEAIDRQSAYEDLKKRAEQRAEAAEKAAEKEAKANKSASKKRTTKSRTRRRSNRQTVGEAAFKSAARTLARELVRGLLGTLKRR